MQSDFAFLGLGHKAIADLFKQAFDADLFVFIESFALFEGYEVKQSLHDIVETTGLFADIVEEDYAGILFSGGRAPEYIRYDENLVRVTRHFFETNKPIASVCHGVEIPAYANCVRGRRMATVAKCQFDLEVCGGIFVNEPCVIDGNLVSGRTFHDNGHYIGPWIKLLEAARDV